MTVKEQWQAWRNAESAEVGIEDYLAWVAELTKEENDSENLFALWRCIPGREAVLRRALNNEIIALGPYNPIFLGLFYALFQTLQGRRCFVTCGEQMPVALLRLVNQRLGALGKLNIRLMGACLGADHVYLGDCQNVDIAIVDYYQFMGALRRNHAQFEKMVQSLFMLDIDVSLYDTRLILLEHGVEHAAAMIYKAPQMMPPDWIGNAAHVDAPMELNELDALQIGGAYSYTDKFTVEELLKLMPKKLKAFPVRSARGIATFTYGTSQARVSALVNDVIKTEGHALIVCCTRALCKLMASEFHKSGQECTETITTQDCMTFFTPSAGEAPKKKVIILMGNPSAMVLPPKPLAKGTMYLAEHFITPNMHEKCAAVGEALFGPDTKTRLYMSQEDVVFNPYTKEGELTWLFNLIDFTEKYDPWRQIRRVLGKYIMGRLHDLRVRNANTTPPLIVSMMDTKPVMDAIIKEKPKRLSKLDAPCFCGSGKPFRECHGKLQK